MARAIFEENGFGAEARIINKLSTELVIPGNLDERFVDDFLFQEMHSALSTVFVTVRVF